MNPLRCLLVAFLLLLPGATALAHKASDSYLMLRAQAPLLELRWDIALRDLEFAIGVDADGDGAITWGEVLDQDRAILSYALARLRVAGDGAECALAPSRPLALAEHGDGTYAVLTLGARCAQTPRALELRYGLLFDVDRLHRGLLRIESGEGATHTAIFSPGRTTQQFDLARVPARATSQFVTEGAWHIWIGVDHLLFLLALLLPAVGHRVHGRWRAVAAFMPAFWDVFRIVTAFTIAHSITLSAAVLGLVALPARWVESVIALSVVVAALNNLVGLIDRARWAIAFAFGLVHGFGFASVLVDLGLPGASIAWALLGFNVGVELGQLVVVAVFLPLAYLLRHSWTYSRLVFAGGSSAVIAIACLWFVERAFDMRLLPGGAG